MLPTPEELRARVPADADLDWIAQDLRGTVIRIADLIPDPRNARKHSQRNMDSIKASLTQFGQRAPLAVNSRTLIVEAGNGRLQAMRELGLEYVAVTFHDDDAVTATSYAIADNRTAELAEWDDGVLGELLTSIQEEGIDLGGIGFSEEDLKWLLPTEEAPHEQKTLDDVEEDLPEEDPTAFWPEFKIRMPKPVHTRLVSAVGKTPPSEAYKELLTLLGWEE